MSYTVNDEYRAQLFDAYLDAAMWTGVSVDPESKEYEGQEVSYDFESIQINGSRLAMSPFDASEYGTGDSSLPVAVQMRISVELFIDAAEAYLVDYPPDAAGRALWLKSGGYCDGFEECYPLPHRDELGELAKDCEEYGLQWDGKHVVGDYGV